MKLIWKIIISIAVVATIFAIIFIAIKYDPYKKNIIENSTTENFIESDSYLEEVTFAENVNYIIDEYNSLINSVNQENDYLSLDDFISSEKAFLNKLESINKDLQNLNYPSTCTDYRNELCVIFEDICIYERMLINSLEIEDESGYESNLNKVNNSFENFINEFNSMINYLQNK